MKPLPIQNSWVLVTGASTGLGRASALRLAASYQAKPLIVGRRLDNLRELQSEIGERFNVPCEIIVADQRRSEEHTSELQSLMRISYAVFCLKKKKHTKTT